MGDAVFPCGTMSGPLSDATMDLDLMDDLLLGGCWLETTDCSDFFQHSGPTSATLLNSLYFLPSSDINNSSSNLNLLQNIDQDGTQGSVLADNPLSTETQIENLVPTQSHKGNMTETTEDSGLLDSFPGEGDRNLDEFVMINAGSELSRRLWIQPSSDAGPASSVKERLIQALSYIWESTKDSDVLIQIWVPIKSGGRNVLTTYCQPFSLNPSCQRLVNYRTVSMSYQFPAEEDSNEAVGLPGRVFLGKLPEWTPDVRYFSIDEYPRVDHAQRFDVRGTLALPVFERGSQACLGVMEVVMTTQKTHYRPELENICNALQAVNLTSSEVLSIPRPKVSNNSYQVALPEILEVLRAVCETHRLPLAQTWVPCMQQGKKGSWHSDENYADCISTIEAACHMTDPCIWGFHEACSDHQLFRGQGVAGKAFTTNQPCFSTDITTFSKMEYPLSHYARMFGLRAAVAIRLRSIYTGIADYVLELFLPVNCVDSEEQKGMLNSLSITIQQVCRSLRVVTDKELEDESILPINEVIPSGRMSSKHLINEDGRLNRKPSIEESSRTANFTQAQLKAHWDQVIPAGKLFLEFKQHHQNSSNGNVDRDSSLGEHDISNAGKATEKRRTRTEKAISLQVLRQYFAGSLKDAAKSIGVCPTTLKRICRQHGITRWPSRKIKKVGHSLRKLQVVINSVQGANGAIQISSLYANFPQAYGSDLTSPHASGSSTFSKLKQANHQKSSNTSQPEVIFSTCAAPEKSPSSSCSQSSSSGLCCSTMAQHHSHVAHLVVSEDASMTESQSILLKKAYSEAELHELGKEEPRPLARSHSHKSLIDHTSLKKLSPLSKSSRVPQDSNLLRLKVTFGEEKVRFSMQPSWGFLDLRQEVVKRFNIDDASMINLKYLDDDSEWVLLTCDDDLQECKDIYKSSRVHSIKLSVHHVAHMATRNSLSSSGPL
ncbi:protein NLP5-like isoform X2 [Magnolia sinica]|uniref:protein NLP5-like isoform X2 n=1 Tax=Magnolia sinica TaxID=86752 RepID=UPI00265AF7A1|nr:protein NLP5-like isoform X2 [Magnolia sinica]